MPILRRRRHSKGWVLHGGTSALQPTPPTSYQLVKGRPFCLERVCVLELYVPLPQSRGL